MSRQWAPFGTAGATGRVQPSSDSSRSALRWLHIWHAATVFSQVCMPPRLRGITWSIVSPWRPQ
jgi:hypothetical protein